MSQRPGSMLKPIDAALDMLLAAMQPVAESELVALSASSGRVLAQAIQASVAVPPHNNSAMDGFAVRASDLSKVPVTLRVSQRIAAGQVGTPLLAGEAARIFTGAPLPGGADAVVMQEDCQFASDAVTILQAAGSGENVRSIGEDIAIGASLFPQGHRLRAQDAGVLASVGLTAINVRRKLRVALLTTGDELVPPGTALQPGQIYNSNFYTLSVLLQALACEVIDLGIVKDELQATRSVLLEAARRADCIISTGGVSVGEEDHVKAALTELGTLDLWKLAIKPGKPLACGSLQGTHFFGLPGNPVSAFVTFCLIVRPCLLRLSGCNQIALLRLRMPAGFNQPESGDRQEYLRVVIQADASHAPVLMPIRNQSSGVGSSLSAAAGLAIIPPYTSVAIGDRLEFIPFSELIN